MNRYGHTTIIKRYGLSGGVVSGISEVFYLDDYEQPLWKTHIMRVELSFNCRIAAGDVSMDFVDPDVVEGPGGTALIGKRVFFDDSGLTSFVSDNLGQGWVVPPRSVGSLPMWLSLEVDSGQGGDLGASSLILERWWEHRGCEGCPPCP